VKIKYKLINLKYEQTRPYFNNDLFWIISDAYTVPNKGNVVLYLDKELAEKSKESGLNISNTFEKHLKHPIQQYSTLNHVNSFNSSENNVLVVGLAGFEPASIEPKSTSLDQASRQPRPISVLSLFLSYSGQQLN
jgi:hypothetical protein